MADTVASGEVAIVIMHNRADKDAAVDIVADIRQFFAHSLELAKIAGIPRSRIILDPGIAFGKTIRQNVEVIARLGELADCGYPIMVGLSRKGIASRGRDRGTPHRHRRSESRDGDARGVNLQSP